MRTVILSNLNLFANMDVLTHTLANLSISCSVMDDGV